MRVSILYEKKYLQAQLLQAMRTITDYLEGEKGRTNGGTPFRFQKA